MSEFIVVNTRDGGVDGYYGSRIDAEWIAKTIRENLGHGDVIVAEYQESPTNPRGRIHDDLLRGRVRDFSNQPTGGE